MLNSRVFCPRFRCVALALLISGISLSAQSLQFRWQNGFPDTVAWYVRTSPCILLVRTGDALTALDGVSGRELWRFPQVEFPSPIFRSDFTAEFWRNLAEIPGKGILLLNDTRLSGGSKGHLLAVNLVTGEQLWQQPPVSDLLGSVLPIRGSSEVLLVAYHFDRTDIAAQLVATGGYLNFGPNQIVFARMDPFTGNVSWKTVFPYVFNWGTHSVQVIGNSIFVNYGNSVVFAVDLSTGKPLWQNGREHIGKTVRELPLAFSNGMLIYSLEDLQAVNSATGVPAWTSDRLGKITGVLAHDTEVNILGSRHLANFELKTGTVRWARTSRPDSTNLLYDRATNSLIYGDYKSISRVDPSSGKLQLEIHVHQPCEPQFLRQAAPDVVLAFGKNAACAFNLSTGKQIFTTGKATSFFQSYVFLNLSTLSPDDPQRIYRSPQLTATADWDSATERTLLPPEYLARLKDFPQADDGSLDAYESADPNGNAQIWWFDAQTSRIVVTHPTGKKHDVCRSLGLVFGVSGKNIWAASIKTN